MITDELASYKAAKRELMPGVEHRQHKRLNKPVRTRAFQTWAEITGVARRA